MDGKAYGSWVTAGWDAWALGAEAWLVAGMRIARIAAGGAEGAAEARLMVDEKVQATLELQGQAAAGGLGATPLSAARGTLKHYRRKVSANRRRLAHGPKR